MLVVRFRGGLGNQMYQYAFCIGLLKRYPDNPVKLDLQEYKAIRHHCGYEIDKIFPSVLKFEHASFKELRLLSGEIPIFYGGPGKKLVDKGRVKINKLKKNTSQRIVVEREYVIRDKEVYQTGNWYFDGYWAGINQYIDILGELQKEFQFCSFTKKKNIELAYKMQRENSVSVHIRRGDYVASAFDILTPEYYVNAIKYINHKIQSPTYYFFSDDGNYVKENFGFIEKKEIVDWNRGSNSFRDMQLMSLCKYNIIANSTFSQWGALLNQNKDRLVLYPSMTAKNRKMETVLLKQWHRLEV